MNVNALQLKNLAQKVYDKYGFVDVIHLASELGVDILVQEKPSDFNAAITYDTNTGKYSILVNLLHPTTRQRFSIAHELSHYVLHKDKLDSELEIHRGIKHDGNRDVEREADKLAGELLMPEERLHQYLNSKNVDKSESLTSALIKETADYFRVSPMAAAIRLRELGYAVSLAYVV